MNCGVLRGYKRINQEKLKRVNEIDKEISEIEKFLDYMTRGRGRLEILNKKSIEKGIIFRRPSCGRLENYDYAVPKELTSEVLKVIRDHREKLISEQNVLWGSE
ncbi:MAG: hypothetical protein ACTID1_00300 [Pseudolactococcus laudensis]